MGLFAPISHFLYAAGMMLVSGSQILYGRYISKDHGRVRSVFSVDLVISFAGSLLVSVFMVLSVLCGWTGVFTSDAAVLGMFNSYLLGQAIGVVPLILGQQLFSFLSLENQTRRTTVASVSCLQKNIDARRAYYTGLCTEEMAGNIVTHGFAIDRKKHSVDIRLTCKEEEIVLRMRDDCAAFNPSQHARILDSGNREERFKDFGIRMVYSLAREVNYQNLLDQNVLTINL